MNVQVVLTCLTSRTTVMIKADFICKMVETLSDWPDYAQLL